MSGATLAFDIIAKDRASGTIDNVGKSAAGAGHKLSVLAKAGIAAGAAIAGSLAGKFMMDSISAASDLNETVSKSQVIFGKSAASILRFGDQASKALGQSKQTAIDAASTFGVFGKSAGLTGGKLAGFSMKMTKLASDMASFSNTSPEQAIEAIGAAMRGEAEPIRAYGVMLDDATLKAEALRLGLLKPVRDQSKIKGAVVAQIEAQKAYAEVVAKSGKYSLEALKADAKLGAAKTSLAKATEGTIPPLTAQQKVLAAQSAIMKQTKDAQGDFARTSGGLANQQRILAAQFEDVKVKVGSALLPVVTKIVTFANANMIPAFDKFGDVLKDVSGFVKDNQDAFTALGVGIATYVVAQKIANAYAVVAGVVSKAYSAGLVVQAGATEAATASQWSLNAALTANPIGLVVAAVALLAGGLYLAYKKSETFRNIVNGLFGVLKPFGAFIGKVLVNYLKFAASAWLLMGEVGVKAFRFLLTAAFATFEGILMAADKGLGWVPGLGGKIHAAREAFTEFGDSTIEKLKGVEDQLHRTRDAINGLHDKTINIDIVQTVKTRGGVTHNSAGGHTPYLLTGVPPT